MRGECIHRTEDGQCKGTETKGVSCVKNRKKAILVGSQHTEKGVRNKKHGKVSWRQVAEGFICQTEKSTFDPGVSRESLEFIEYRSDVARPTSLWGNCFGSYLEDGLRREET